MFMRRTKYNVGNFIFSIDDILVGILRGNRQHVVFGRRFKKDDPRRGLVMDKPDPRIHFIISQINYPGPGVGIFYPENVEAKLVKATEKELVNNLKVSGEQVVLPFFLHAVRADFGKHLADLLNFITRYATPELQAKLKAVKEKNVNVNFDSRERSFSTIKRSESIKNIIQALEECNTAAQ